MEQQKGFSLIELLLVVVIIAVVAALAVPAYQKGLWAAENGSALSNLRIMGSTQVQFYSQNERFGNLQEIRAMNNGIGTVAGDRLFKSRYVFEMTPEVPTPGELKTKYTIAAIREVEGQATYRYEIDESGKIRRIFPTASEDASQ